MNLRNGCSFISRNNGDGQLSAFPILPNFCLILFELKNSEGVDVAAGVRWITGEFQCGNK
jgi:hypothetical protein